ncbi:SDR family NAD(P)-dependent oxidoreductase [Frankia sp. Cas3]|uniref:SDR family NAD(P)-dependent oxidoreductase n=1 Tax=Frankia sp. Cas3 TaxID=3073926 RepID=UPI002AD4FF78|nr:SDR family NAD(P)-dependent oxidoreductase [Frankia sp. Cas3]
MTSLEGTVALVTGSSRGIGAEIARLFAAEGAHVVLHGRDRDALDRVHASITAANGQALVVTGDVTRYDDLEAMRTTVEDEVGPVTILVANAGGSTTPPAPLEDISPADWRAAVDGNLTATFLTIKCFLPGMKARGAGAIITMSSAAARRPSPFSPLAYATAKAGVGLLTQDAAAQAGPHGVRINCIAPEAILTERNSTEIPPAVQAHLRDQHPIRRLGTPNDVARAALFLATDNSAWITGIILDVAGGSVLT